MIISNFLKLKKIQGLIVLKKYLNNNVNKNKKPLKNNNNKKELENMMKI